MTFFRAIERGVLNARSYRGKVLSFEQESSYSGQSSGVKVHHLRSVAREENLVRLYSQGTTLAAEVAEMVKRTEKVSASFIKEVMRRSAQFNLEREAGGELNIADVNNALEEMLFSGGMLNRKLLGADLRQEQDQPHASTQAAGSPTRHHTS